LPGRQGAVATRRCEGDARMILGESLKDDGFLRRPGDKVALFSRGNSGRRCHR